MKNSNDTIRSQTRDLPACSAMSQSTAKPRALYRKIRDPGSLNLLYSVCPVTAQNKYSNEALPFFTSKNCYVSGSTHNNVPCITLHTHIASGNKTSFF